jgi:hypothetical protein
VLPSRTPTPLSLPPLLTQANTSKSNVFLSNSAQSSRGVLCFIPSVRAAASFPALASSSPAWGSGWWKDQPKRDRRYLGARYALVVSLETPGVETDIWTPVAQQVGVPIEVVS